MPPTTTPSCSTTRSCHGCAPGRRTVIAAQSSKVARTRPSHSSNASWMTT